MEAAATLQSQNVCPVVALQSTVISELITLYKNANTSSKCLLDAVHQERVKNQQVNA
jgi:hypothetical protein